MSSYVSYLLGYSEPATVNKGYSLHQVDDEHYCFAIGNENARMEFTVGINSRTDSFILRRLIETLEKPDGIDAIASMNTRIPIDRGDQPSFNNIVHVEKGFVKLLITSRTTTNVGAMLRITPDNKGEVVDFLRFILRKSKDLF